MEPSNFSWVIYDANPFDPRIYSFGRQQQEAVDNYLMIPEAERASSYSIIISSYATSNVYEMLLASKSNPLIREQVASVLFEAAQAVSSKRVQPDTLVMSC